MVHMQTLKAVILAGGKGTRARPFTDHFPKAMMPVFGKPLISRVVDYLLSFDFISEVIIVSDFEGPGGQIKHYFEGPGDSGKIRFVQDSGSGTGGDLLHIADIVKDRAFFLWFVDNLCAVDLKKMYQHHTKKGSLACIATRKYRKEETGFAKVRDGIILEFVEKPTVRLPNVECLGIYVLSRKVLELIKKKSKTKKDINLSFDVLEELSKKGRVSSFDISNIPWIDAESPAKLGRSEEIVKKILKQMS